MSQNVLNLRIVIPATNVTKMMQFNSDIPISEVIQDIVSKVPDVVRPGTKVEDYCLYRQDQEDEKIGVWFNRQVTLSQYNVKQGVFVFLTKDPLELREVNRPLKFKLPDGTMKTIMIDETKMVGEIFKTICSRSGITTIDEYSLAVEDMPEDTTGGLKKDQTVGTTKKDKSSLGLTMKKIEEREKKKLEKMKQKLHTDDEIRWVEHDKPLCEQGIDKTYILLLKRKYFYESNRNILDPMEVNILYNQCRDSILSGTLICGQDEVMQLAAIQIHIQTGDFNENRYKTLNVKEFIPKEHHRNAKSLEKKIKEEHKLLVGVQQSEAKQKYATICQSLKLYGVSIFLVKEKIPGKQKLGPILFGITKECVMRLDEKTKEVVKTWPLTSVRRWAASPNSFTLDFGDYDEMYSIMTSESEQISKLISGYIDLILRKKRAQASATSSTGVALLEENIMAGQGVVISTGGKQGMGGALGVGGKSAQVSGRSGMAGSARGGPQARRGQGGRGSRYGQAQKFTHPQKAFVHKLADIQDNIQDDVDNVTLPGLPDSNFNFTHTENQAAIQKKIISTNLTNLAECLINLSQNVQSKENLDYSLLCNQMSESKQSLIQASRALTQLSEFDKDINSQDLNKLIQDLVNGYKDIFVSIKITDEKVSEIDYEKFTNGLAVLSKSQEALLKSIKFDNTPQDVQDNLLELSKLLSQRVSDLINNGRQIAKETKDEISKNTITDQANFMDFERSKVEALVVMLAPMVNDPKNSEFIIKSCNQLIQSMTNLTNCCDKSGCDGALPKLHQSNDLANESANAIIETLKNYHASTQETDPFKCTLAKLMFDFDQFDDNLDLEELKERSKEFSNNLSKLLNLMKSDINNTTDEDLKKDLFEAAKSLADMTKLLIDNVKLCQSDQIDEAKFLEMQKSIYRDADKFLRDKYGKQIDEINLKQLKSTVDKVVSASILMQSAMRTSSESCRSEQLGKNLLDEADSLEKQCNELINASANCQKSPDSFYNQQELIEACKSKVVVSNKSINVSKNALPLLSDIDHSYSLNKSIKNLQPTIEELESISSSFETNPEIKIDVSKLRMEQCQKHLAFLKEQFEADKIAHNEDSPQPHYARLIEIHRQLMRCHTQCSDGSNYEDLNSISNLLDQISQSLIQLLTPVYNISACSLEDDDKKAACSSMYDTIQSLIASDINICKNTQQMIKDQHFVLSEDLLEALKNSSDMLLNLISSIPTSKELEAATQTIKNLMADHEARKPPLPLRPDTTYIDLQKGVTQDVSTVLETLTEILRLVPRKDVQQVPIVFSKFTKNLGSLYSDTKSLYTFHPDKETGKEIRESLHSLLINSNKLATITKLYTNDPNTETEHLFSESVKNLSNILSHMLITMLSSKPGRRECEDLKNAIRLKHQNALENSNVAIFPKKSYKECINEIETARDKTYPAIISKLNNAIESDSKIVDIAPIIAEYDECVTSILQNTEHATYLIGMSDSDSVSGSSTIIDKDELRKNIDALALTFDQLPKSTKSTNQSDIDSFNKDLSKHTTAIISSCKDSVSRLTGNPSIQKEVLDIVNSISLKTKDASVNIKNFEKVSSDNEWKQVISDNKQGLNSTCLKLLEFYESPNLSSLPSQISERGRFLQEPIIGEGLGFMDSVAAVMEGISSLIQDFNSDIKASLNSTISKSSEQLNHVAETFKSQSNIEEVLNDVIQQLQRNSQDISEAREQVLSQAFPQSTANSKEHETRFEYSADQIKNLISELSAIDQAELHLNTSKIEMLSDLMEGMLDASVGMAISLDHLSSDDQSSIFHTLSALNNSTIHVVNSFKNNPDTIDDAKPLSLDKSTANALDELKNLRELISTLSRNASKVQAIVVKISKLNESIASKSKIDAIPSLQLANLDFENVLTEKLKNIALTSQTMASKAAQNPEFVETKAEDILKDLEVCAAILLDTSIKTFPPNILNSLQTNYLRLGESCKIFIQSCYNSKDSSNKAQSRKELSQQSRKIANEVSNLLKVLQTLHVGSMACTKISADISELLNELDTLVLFAENGSLEKEFSAIPIHDLSETIKEHRGSLASAISNLSKLSQINDRDMANFADSVGSSAKEFLDTNKNFVLSMGSRFSDQQLDLLNASIGVGSCMVDLIDNIKKSDKTQKETVDDHVHKFNEKLDQHQKVLHDVEKKMLGGLEAIGATIKQIESLLGCLNKKTPCEWDSSLHHVAPEDVIRHSKDIPLSCIKMTQALNAGKISDMGDLADKAFKSFQNLYKGIRKLILESDETTLKDMISAAQACTRAYLDFLSEINKKGLEADKNILSEKSKNVKESVVVFVKKCSDLKGSEYVDPNDPSVLAEKELLNAAAAIEMAAKKLSELRPRVATGTANKELNFEGQILEAANSIMNCTALLVAAATSAQKELVQSGTFKNVSGGGESGQWSQGLISAARLVADSTNMLCDAAKDAVEGKAGEEKLVAACNSISASTTQLIMACKVKADPNSENQARLEKAGNAVKKASKTLVESLKGSGVFKAEKDEKIELGGSVNVIKQELDAMEEILKREKELKEAREKLFKIRQAKADAKKDQ